MVRDNIEENLHPLLVRRGDEFLIFAKRSQMRVDRVEIDGSIAVIVLRRAILDDGREPKSGDAEISQIAKMILNSPQITPMICTRPVADVGSNGVRRLIICGIAVGEAIRHDEINDVLRGEPLKLVDGLGSRFQRQLERSRAGRSSDPAHCGAGFRLTPEFQPHKKIISTYGRLGALHNNSGEITGHLGGLEVAAIKQQGKVRGQADPPVGWLNLCD